MSPCQGSPLTATNVLWEQLFRVYQDWDADSLQGYGTHPGIQGKNILGLHGTYVGMNGGWAKLGGDHCGLARSECWGSTVCVCDRAGLCAREFVTGVELWPSGAHMPDTSNGISITKSPSCVCGVGEHSYWIQWVSNFRYSRNPPLCMNTFFPGAGNRMKTLVVVAFVCLSLWIYVPGHMYLHISIYPLHYACGSTCACWEYVLSFICL